MTFFLSSTLLLLAAITSAVAQSEEKDFQCASFDLEINANYPDNVAVRCTEKEFDIMNELIKSIVQIDVLGFQVYDDVVPDFDLAFEKYNNDVIVDHTGTVATPADAAEIAANMKPEDELEDMIYDAEIDASEDSAARRLELLRAMSQQEGPKRLRGSREEEIAVQQEEEDEDHGWTMIDGGLSGKGPRAADLDGRNLKKADCGTSKSCKHSWCCKFCGYNCKSRRILKSDGVSTLRTPVTQSPTSKAPATLSPSLSPSFEPTQAPSASPSLAPTPIPEAVRFAQRVEAMESRVTKELIKKFRFLARHGIIGCLGNFWELEIMFKSNLEMHDH